MTPALRILGVLKGKLHMSVIYSHEGGDTVDQLFITLLLLGLILLAATLYKLFIIYRCLITLVDSNISKNSSSFRI